MEPRVSPSQAEADEVEVRATINIRVRSSQDRAVTTCEPKVKRGDRVTFALTDVGASFKSATITIHSSAPRPLLLDANGTQVDEFKLTPRNPERTFTISTEHPPDDSDEPRFFEVDAAFENGEVSVLRDDSCFTSADGTAMHRHQRPRMVIIIA